MSKYSIKSKIFLFFLLCPALTFGETTPPEKKPLSILPTRLMASIDVFRPLYYGFKAKTGLQNEFNVNLNFKRLLLEGEYGWGHILRKNPRQRKFVLNDHVGQYFRVGLSYNFIPPHPKDNAAFLGFRYSRAYGRDYMYGNYYNPREKKVQKSTAPAEVDQDHLFTAWWLEVVAGIRLQLGHGLYAGLTARYKFAKHIVSEHPPFDLLGWGLNEDHKGTFGFNYYIGFSLPLQADPKKTTPKKNSLLKTKK